MFPTMIKPRKIHNSKSVLVKVTMSFMCFWCNFQEVKLLLEKHCFLPVFVSLFGNNVAPGINLVNDKHETCPKYKLAEEISYIKTVLMNLRVSDAVHDTMSQLFSFFGTLHLRDCLYLPRSQLFC